MYFLKTLIHVVIVNHCGKLISIGKGILEMAGLFFFRAFYFISYFMYICIDVSWLIMQFRITLHANNNQTL